VCYPKWPSQAGVVASEGGDNSEDDEEETINADMAHPDGEKQQQKTRKFWKGSCGVLTAGKTCYIHCRKRFVSYQD
jgi:hypothetical protein